MLFGYASTSTLEQLAGHEAQQRDLKEYGREKVYKGQVSSVHEREQLDAALVALCSDYKLVVTKLDRLTRSVIKRFANIVTTIWPNSKALLLCASTVLLCCMPTLSYAEKSCEEGATNMVEIYECLARQNKTMVESEYHKLSDTLVAQGMLDALKLLENSQLAWESDTQAYCNMLLEIAEPSFGLYAHDLGSNCRTQRSTERGEALKLLYLAVEQEQFGQWMQE